MICVKGADLRADRRVRRNRVGVRAIKRSKRDNGDFDPGLPVGMDDCSLTLKNGTRSPARPH